MRLCGYPLCVCFFQSGERNSGRKPPGRWRRVSKVGNPILPSPKSSPAIENFLWERGGIDVADLVGAVVSLWRQTSEWLEDVRKRYRVLAVDELQDINLLQYRFLTLLGRGKEVLAIGDPDQAIYGFRGADQRLFFRFKQEFEARIFSLNRNFRCPNIVVEAANSLIRHNTEREEMNIFGGKNGPSSIPWFHAADEREEAEYLLSLIEHYVGGSSHLAMERLTEQPESYAFSDIAVLFRLHSLGKGVVETSSPGRHTGSFRRGRFPSHGDALLPRDRRPSFLSQ